MIQWALEEIVQAGIPHVVVVVSPSKSTLAKFLARWKPGRGVKLTTVAQPRAIGLDDALLRVESISKGRPIALVLPDNVFFPYAGARPALTQVIEGFTATGKDTVGLIRVAKRDAFAFGHAGLVSLSKRRGPLADIHKLHSKRKGTLRFRTGVSAHKTFARAILHPHFFQYLRESMRPGHGGDEVPALQTIVKRHGFSGVLLRGRGFDAGNPGGLAAAIAYWARRAGR
jgi:UTP-glucose-1-phosphate uridylyltransferase